jgi:prefoldin subunit 5
LINLQSVRNSYAILKGENKELRVTIRSLESQVDKAEECNDDLKKVKKSLS